MSLYIRGIGNISAQETFGSRAFPEQPVFEPLQCLSAIEPDYKEWIQPMTLRRMARILRMGIAAAGQALKDANLESPDAVLTATALGCTQDTDRFLRSMIEREEQTLAPTAFIQSTHNTIGGQIALQNKWHVYNMCYSQRGASFETALYDALLLGEEGRAENILLGAIDELITPSVQLMARLGMYRVQPVHPHELLQTRLRGTTGGEGAMFMVLGSGKEHSYAEVMDVETHYKPGEDEVLQLASRFLERNKLGPQDIDLFVIGRNGDQSAEPWYDRMEQHLFSDHQPVQAAFKHLSGEYHTAVSFGLWMAAMTLHHQYVPDYALLSGEVVRPLKHALLYNHFLERNHSFILVSTC
ncbi:MAG: 3-oxoacyl-ACP synthase [Cryomorphaceae bacterium]|nr:MAG: 3-oxoacyl-ACP synthase [Cryomorphaceae bacterium]